MWAECDMGWRSGGTKMVIYQNFIFTTKVSWWQSFFPETKRNDGN
jgi:hypothetical protein